MTSKTSSRPKSGPFKTRARRILRDALKAVDPEILIRAQISLRNETLAIGKQTFNLRDFGRIHVLGAGKAVEAQYRGIRKILGRRISGGIIVAPDNCSLNDQLVKIMAGNHPVPGQQSFRSGGEVIRYISGQVNAVDLVVVLISGGASSVLAYPAPGMEKKDKQGLIRELIRSSAAIGEINCVRKHISALKGGRLAEMAYPARIITLVLSDIIGSPLQDIGSGPTMGDSSTFSRARDIIRRYIPEKQVNPRIKEYFSRGMAGQVPETPLPGSEKLSRNHPFLLGDNRVLLAAAEKSAEQQGIKTRILTSSDRGEARQAARFMAAVMEEMILFRRPVSPPVLLLSGGELTVSLKGRGRGGRNQEFVLQMLRELRHMEKPFFVQSVGTDGIDGPTDAAGAWIDHQTMKKVRKLGLDIEAHLENNDSYSFFKKIDQLVITGPTGTNVMDFRMFYIP